jgi:predicted GIY-YIG superfamily endonuclease
MQRYLALNVIRPPSDHMCYILRSAVSNRVYIGYTINFSHRIRQHNGEITGGAKKTRKWRPWIPVCVIKGFYDSSSALRFEYRLQHSGKRRKAGEDSIMFTLQTLIKIINNGDGSVAKDNKMPWPPLIIEWYSSQYNIPTVTNLYVK